jgi:hypothetical protein
MKFSDSNMFPCITLTTTNELIPTLYRYRPADLPPEKWHGFNLQINVLFYLILSGLRNRNAFWKDPGFRPCVHVIATRKNYNDLSDTGGMIRGKTRRNSKKICPLVTLPATKLVWTGLGMKSVLRRESPVTVHLQ